MGIADTYAPIGHSKVKREYKPWLNEEIKKTSYHRDYLKKKADYTPTFPDFFMTRIKNVEII